MVTTSFLPKSEITPTDETTPILSDKTSYRTNERFDSPCNSIANKNLSYVSSKFWFCTKNFLIFKHIIVVSIIRKVFNGQISGPRLSFTTRLNCDILDNLILVFLFYILYTINSNFWKYNLSLKFKINKKNFF